MARTINQRDLSPTLEAAQRWLESSLIEDRSLFVDAILWTSALVEECREAFVEHPDEGDDDFMTKLRGQMEKTSPDAKRLMAEMLWALLLFPSNVRPATKRQHVRSMWSASGSALPEAHPLLANDVLMGIGSGGPGFNNHRWRELAYFIKVAASLKAVDSEQRRTRLTSYDAFIQWLSEVPQEGHRQFRHMLRYFAFPERVERMSSNRDRRRVLEGFDVAPERETRHWTDRQLDDALVALRARLQEEDKGAVLDFYEPPLKTRWQSEEIPIPGGVHKGDTGGAPSATVWIEKTIVRGRPDRQSGEYALGRMLWSPQQDKRGADIYRFMRDVKPGDVVLHLTDNEGFTGVSTAASQPEDFVGLAGTVWGNRPGYRVRLRDYRELDPPLMRETFFRPPYVQRLVKLLDNGLQTTFFNREPALNQGAYLTPAPPELLEVLNDAYRDIAGVSLLDGAPQPDPALDGASEDLKAIAATFGEELKRSHLDFGPDHDSLVRAFVASLATKRFVILTGLSGSGKSQIAIKLGQWLGPSSYRLIAVRPDWTGPDALFGYEDALQKSKSGSRAWQVPDSLAFILEAAANPRRLYLLILDEMNLAHVERYFADALSGIETVEPCVPDLMREADGVWIARDGSAGKLPFPRNLLVIGTVNVDETTYLFSPKVLDRANTFEFRVATAALSSDARKPRAASRGPEELTAGLLTVATRDDWHLVHPAPWVELYTAHLRTLHELLAESSLEFGHRVYYEAVRFAAIHWACGADSMEASLDRQVMQKILPRIHGGRKRVEPALCSLGKFALDLSFEAGTAQPGISLAFDPTKEIAVPPKLPLSFDKIRRMVVTLRANQFTSFTD